MPEVTGELLHRRIYDALGQYIEHNRVDDVSDLALVMILYLYTKLGDFHYDEIAGKGIAEYRGMRVVLADMNPHQFIIMRRADIHDVTEEENA